MPLVHELFERQCLRTASTTAIQCGLHRISYSELNKKANSLAKEIRSNFPFDPILAVSTTRNIEMVIAILAVLKSGKAYLPLDSNYPIDRLAVLISDAGISGAVSLSTERKIFESLGLKVVASDNLIVEDDKNQITDATLAYVLYTSGSTGKPKGVCMGHQALVNLIEWQRSDSKATIGTNTLQFAPLSFDVSFQEIFCTLTTGGTLILIEDDWRMDPYRLLQFIEKSSVHRLFLPFVALQQLSEVAVANNIFPQSLKEIMTAGEQLKITPQVRSFFEKLPGCVLFNQYGPTEAHVVSSITLKGNRQNWPSLPSIGKPIYNTQLFVLDEELNILPHGSTGELCISGICVAEKYLNNATLTAEKFIDWKHPEQGNLRIYRTGDLAIQLPDGAIEFLGRRDEQVKIRGHRVEPGEIEIALNTITGIQQAVVTVREDGGAEKRLVAYVVSADQSKDTVALRQALQNKLPDYMIPSAIVWLDSLPKTVSGKVDKKALPKPATNRPELSTLYQAPVTEAEKKIAGLWSVLLDIHKIGIADNFFELGGNSLLAVKMIVQLKQQFGFDLPVTKLYQYPTIKRIAHYVTHQQSITVKASRSVQSSNGVAVIGMSGRFPGADTIDELWKVLTEGRETIRSFSDEELHHSISDTAKNDPLYVKKRGTINGADTFDASFFGLNPKVAELMDPQQRIFLEIAWEVLEQTGHLPDKYHGSIGVFAGSGNNSYYLNNVLSNKKLIENVGAFQVMTVNEKDYLATRVAYQLDLKGPAVSVYSGCSTSLLAIAQAAESIRNGRCQVALAGGVAIHAPINSGQYYEEGAMFSPDGSCRPFDKDARGTVFSDGAGVVLLKSLEEAIRDNDTIYAVLKGVGYNNDGAEKGSFTAPSAEGQAGAIAQALGDAGIEPSAISYIETHGTATPIGDPIEIDGLNLAFGTQEQKQFCAIGSVKSNIGHLTAAAGVAGFIKTILSIYHKQIPATVHFKQPNANINFEGSPFFVNASLRAWESTAPRRAGVSSFGVGGTNVHVILEEYDNAATSTASTKPFYLVPWSARSETSRENYAKHLGAFIGRNISLEISSLAYTLQATRKEFKCRRFSIATSSADLHTKLMASTVTPSEIKTLEEICDEVVFMFPGQGSQYNGMGRDLYASETVFREAVDECASILEVEIKEDIRQILFAEGDESREDSKLDNTAYTQPALFAVEYGLAKLWMSWGIKPAAMVGHSIGEYVAAHLAGVFSLKDALVLLSARSRLMASMATGTMLSVQKNEEELKKILPETLSIAALNTSKLSVVAGKTSDIESFRSLLDKEGVTARVLKTSHAFHSSLMEPMLEPFLHVAESISYNAPKIPIVSTLTGTWINGSKMTDPSYWTKQVRGTVRFADALETIGLDKKRLLLEVGPGSTTSTFARHQLGAKGFVSVAGLMHDPENNSEYYSVLRSLGQLWLNGVQPQWKSLYDIEPSRIPAVPAYAFDKKRCWVEAAMQPADHETGNMKSTPVAVIPADKVSLSPQFGQENILQRIRQILHDSTGVDINQNLSNTSFIELGLDSLLLTQMAFTIKKEFNVAVTFRQLNEDYTTVESLASFLFSSTPPSSAGEYNVNAPTQLPIEESKVIEKVGNTNENLLALIRQQLDLLTKQVALIQAKETPGGSSFSYGTTNESQSEEKTLAETMETHQQEIQRPFQQAPVSGARLGKDSEGCPAWFIPDESRPGKYLQVDFFHN